MTSLELTLLYLAAAVLGVVLCSALRLPAMLGYLMVGVVIGPNALALAENVKGVHYLGEFGVVFLMFVIGLEFNLPKLKTMRHHVFGLGAAQVLITLAATVAGALGLAAVISQLAGTPLGAWLAPWQVSWQTALALSGALAMSSTAIVAKLLAERQELDSDHGKRVMGVLLFQDLAVVPLLVLIPALGAPPEALLTSLAWATLKAAVLITLLLTGGQHLMGWWLKLVAQRAKETGEELFVLNVLLITLGLAWLTEAVGLSLALGAFIAGMLVSETPYKHQLENDIRPFHDILLGLFFISIGMLLDWQQVVQHWALVGILFALPLIFKLALVTWLSRKFGASDGTALRTGLYLTQAGEFGFVLLTLAQQNSLVPPHLLNPVLASMVLSMLATPFIILRSEALVLRWVKTDWLMQSLQTLQIASHSMAAQGHVLIIGYGRSGETLARHVALEGLTWRALDINPERVQTVREGSANNDASNLSSLDYGDGGKKQALLAAGAARARAVVVTLDQTQAALRCLAALREMGVDAPIIVRSRNGEDSEALLLAGASEVVSETLEGAVILASRTLMQIGLPCEHLIATVGATTHLSPHQ